MMGAWYCIDERVRVVPVLIAYIKGIRSASIRCSCLFRLFVFLYPCRHYHRRREEKRSTPDCSRTCLGRRTSINTLRPNTLRSTHFDQHTWTNAPRPTHLDQRTSANAHPSAHSDQHTPISTLRSAHSDQHTPISTLRPTHFDQNQTRDSATATDDTDHPTCPRSSNTARASSTLEKKPHNENRSIQGTPFHLQQGKSLEAMD
jgi:hypothetical protein